MLVYLCLSSHGYGHAARQASILYELQRIRPSYRLVVSCNINNDFLNVTFADIKCEFRKFMWDIGTCQYNAFDINLDNTLKKLEDFECCIERLTYNEIEWIKKQDLETIIIGDIPPSAAHLAKALGSKLIWFGNFGWDEIYKPFGNQFIEYISKYKNSYTSGDLLIRCPFSLDMDWGIPEVEVGLTIARKRRITEDFLFRILQNNCPIIIVGFGGFGFEVDIEMFDIWRDFVFILPEAIAKSSGISSDNKNIIILPSQIRFLDILGYCSRIITKPGYSTFCESIAEGIGVHAFQRENFIESKALLDGLKSNARYRILDKKKLLLGDWELDKPLIKSYPNSLELKGASKAAEEICNFIDRN